jgi:hypothetical protein
LDVFLIFNFRTPKKFKTKNIHEEDNLIRVLIDKFIRFHYLEWFDNMNDVFNIYSKGDGFISSNIVNFKYNNLIL